MYKICFLIYRNIAHQEYNEWMDAICGTMDNAMEKRWNELYLRA